MIKIDESSGVPIYLQLVAGLKKDILSGVYVAEDRLPSIRDVALELKVNPNTVAKAYQEMETQGIIYFKRGQGAFVVPRTREENMKEAQEEVQKLLVEVIEMARSLGIENEALLTLMKEQMGKRSRK